MPLFSCWAFEIVPLCASASDCSIDPCGIIGVPVCRGECPLCMSLVGGCCRTSFLSCQARAGADFAPEHSHFVVESVVMPLVCVCSVHLRRVLIGASEATCALFVIVCCVLARCLLFGSLICLVSLCHIGCFCCVRAFDVSPLQCIAFVLVQRFLFLMSPFGNMCLVKVWLLMHWSARVVCKFSASSAQAQCKFCASSVRVCRFALSLSLTKKLTTTYKLYRSKATPDSRF